MAALREFITDWYVSYLSVDETRGQPEAGPQERLSKTGSNLANVVQYLNEQHPDQLRRIFDQLRRRVPRIEKVVAEAMPDGRLLLGIKDAPFAEPIMARFASDGTLKMLAYLLILLAPSPPQFIGIEEPESFLHPRLLPELGEECRAATARARILATTHSPFFLNALRPEEVRVLYRDVGGFTQTIRVADIRGVPEFIKAGALLGHLWMEGHLGAGDPLVRSGAAYPRVSRTIASKAMYRAPDAIKGGTWEAFERVLRVGGYATGGLGKIESARAVAAHMEPARSTSPSFRALRDALAELAA